MKAYLNLGDNLGDIKSKKIFFSASEVHMTVGEIPEGVDEVIINAKGRNHTVGIDLMQTVDILRRKGIKSISLHMPYFYYSRQDRATTKNSSFALEVFCKMLRVCNFKTITTIDIHSEVTENLLPNLKNIKPAAFLNEVLTNVYDYIISPDTGATKKIYSLGVPRDMIVTATKHRDPETGLLSSPTIKKSVEGMRVLIFDDICDGGYTFIQLAKIMKAESADLAVTHGIFSKGTKELKKYFNNIYTTDSFPQEKGIITL